MTTSTSPPSSSRTAAQLDLGPARVLWTGRRDGDLGIDAGPGLDARRRAVHDGPWSWLRQVHGAAVHVVAGPGDTRGEEGDALVTAAPGAALAVFTADCAPVALSSPEGAVGVVHAGWRGVEAGVVEATVEKLRALGASRVDAAIGPCIHPCCYAFGASELVRLQRRLGRSVGGRTSAGAPALDLPAAVTAALGAAGATVAFVHPACTGCTDGWFSHRARGERERQATLVMRRAEGDAT